MVSKLVNLDRDFEFLMGARIQAKLKETEYGQTGQRRKVPLRSELKKVRRLYRAHPNFEFNRA